VTAASSLAISATVRLLGSPGEASGSRELGSGPGTVVVAGGLAWVVDAVVETGADGSVDAHPAHNRAPMTGMNRRRVQLLMAIDTSEDPLWINNDGPSIPAARTP